MGAARRRFDGVCRSGASLARSRLRERDNEWAWLERSVRLVTDTTVLSSGSNHRCHATLPDAPPRPHDRHCPSHPRLAVDGANIYCTSTPARLDNVAPRQQCCQHTNPRNSQVHPAAAGTRAAAINQQRAVEGGAIGAAGSNALVFALLPRAAILKKGSGGARA
jgi:hypothetical protein